MAPEGMTQVSSRDWSQGWPKEWPEEWSEHWPEDIAKDDEAMCRMTLSALLDGEADTASAPVRETLDACLAGKTPSESASRHIGARMIRTWRGYNLVGAVIRKEYAGAAIDSLVDRVHEAVAAEPRLSPPSRQSVETQRGRPGRTSTAAPAIAARHGHTQSRLGRKQTPGQPQDLGGRAKRPSTGARPRQRTAVAAAAVAAVGAALWFAQDARQPGDEVAKQNPDLPKGTQVTQPGGPTVARLERSASAPESVASASEAGASVTNAAVASATVKRIEPGRQFSGADQTAFATMDFQSSSPLAAADNVQVAPALYTRVSPEEQRRWNTFLLQHAEYQGASAGSPVMPYVVLVSGATQ